MNTVGKSIADSKSTVSIYPKEKIIFQKNQKIKKCLTYSTKPSVGIHVILIPKSPWIAN